MANAATWKALARKMREERRLYKHALNRLAERYGRLLSNEFGKCTNRDARSRAYEMKKWAIQAAREQTQGKPATAHGEKP